MKLLNLRWLQDLHGDHDNSVSIWRYILNVKQIGIHDDFFESGGNSLLAVQLFAQIKSVTDKELPMALVFHSPTIHQIANAIQKEEWSAKWASLVPIQTKGSKQDRSDEH